MGPIERAMTAFFDGVDWPHEPAGDGSIRLYYDGEHATYECKAAAFDNDDADEGLFLFDCFCPLVIPDDLREPIARFSGQVNQRSIYGWMTCDAATGVVRVRSSFYVTQWFKAQPAMIGPVVQFTVNVMDDYLPAIASLLAGEMDVDAAFDRATAG